MIWLRFNYNIIKGYSTLDDEKGYVLGRILEAGALGYCQVLIVG